MEQQIIEKRVKLENPRDFFGLIKESPKYSSWKGLVEAVDCGNTALKACRRGERTFQGKVFLDLLDYLTEEQKNQVLSRIELLDENWGSKKGTEKIVELGKDFRLSRIKLDVKRKLFKMIKNKDSLSKIAKQTELKKTTIYYYTRKINGRTYFEPEFDLNYSEIEGEVVGIFTGDGSQHYAPNQSHYQVNVHFGKADYAAYVKALFEGYFDKKFRLQDESLGRRRLIAYSRKIFHHFKNYLEYDPKIKHSTVRLKTLDFPKGFLIGFLRGLLDTDGTVCRCANNRINIAYYTTSKNLAQQIQKILEIFNINCGHCVVKRSGFKDLHQVYILARSKERFLDIIKPFKLRRLGLLAQSGRGK